jgi:iron complex transport system ATP-binding protein
MSDPELLLLDEPVASLDLAARELTLRLLGGYASAESAPAMAMVTHHIEEIPIGFTHALLIRNGDALFQGELHEVINSANISATYDFDLRVDFRDGRFSAVAG